MFFRWSFLFAERPIPDEINPLSRTQVPLLLLVYGVLSFHREVPKVKYSELTVFGGALTLVTSHRTVLYSDVTKLVRSR